MADKRISQLIERVDIANNDVLPIVASGATTTNKVTVSTLQDWMQDNLDVGVTSVGLSMPSAFVVSASPVTSSGNISVTGAGTVAQYIRGDGSLADFPSGGGGGGSSVNYYLNGSVSQGTIGGIAYQEMNKTPVLGAGTDFTIAADGYIASFITDAGDPALLEIPAGNWNFETYFQASSGGGTPSFYIELYKVNSGGTATLIASNSGSPELIAFGTTTTPYFSALAVPTTSLTLTDRLALRYYVTHSGRTITLHTENSNLCQIITTFTTGLTALNGLTAQVQNFATGTSGTDFAISSSVSTHTFNLPNASATARGVVSTGSQTFAGAKTFNSDIIVNGITIGKGGASNGNNTAIGMSALSSNTTGTLNTATGLSALQYNTLGNGNTANGANSLLANTTGAFNTASGNQSLYSNTTGSNNTASGVDALYSNIGGNHNTGIGAGAGYYIADGSTPNTTSDFSIYLGSNSKASVDGAQNEVVIGYNAIGSGSNTVTIGNASTTNNYFTGNIRGGAFIKSGGTSSQFLMADGSVNTSVLASGAYLPLAGGTLTGALNGTSASFSGKVSSSTNLGFENNNGSQAGFVANYTGTGATKVSLSTYNNTFAIYDETNGRNIISQNTSTQALSFTGAATFSSSVTANGVMSLGNDGTFGTNYKTLGLTGNTTGTHRIFAGTSDDFFFAAATGRGFEFRANGGGVANLYIASSGNVGIGTASPSEKLSIFTSASAEVMMTLKNGSQNLSFGVNNAAGSFIYEASNTALRFGTNDTERMRITSGGDVQIGLSDNYAARTLYIGTATNGSTGQGGQALYGGPQASQDTGHESGTASGSNYHRFILNGNVIGSITQSGVSAVQYNTSSDYRLKEDLQEIKGLEKIQAIKVYNYKWKAEESRMDGVLAHELAEVLPYAVHGEKDEVDEEGNDKMQGVDYSKIVPILIKAIQELKTEIDSLKNQINQL